MNKFKKTMLYAGLEKREFEPLLPEAREQNGRYMVMYSSMTAVLFAVCLLTAILAGGKLTVNRPVYATMVVLNVLFYLCARLVLPRRKRLSTLLAVCYILSLYGYAFAISLLHPDAAATAAVAFLLVMPALFFYRPVYMILLTLAVEVVYFVLAARIKAAPAALMDLWNSLFFGSISLLLSVYQMRVKFQLIQEKRKTRQLSETDLLTGVRNRNSFETGRGGYAERCRESLTCVFVDVNGLHELNDTQGHEAGDVMLQTVARAVSDAFGAADTFRIGGDEFVVFSTDVPLTGTRERIGAVLRDVAAMGYSVSVGVSRQEKAALDVDELVKDAERNMYREKKRYYEQSGHDRRQRVLDA